MMIAHGHALQNDQTHAEHFISLAKARKKALLKFCWDADKKYFFDYDFKGQQLSKVKTMAAVYPLFFQLAESSQAKDVAHILETEFLKQGGLLYTLTASGQQWDAPNGWAPMQWLAYKGLKNYKIDALANTIKTRWLKLNERVYKTTGKMMEKYNVVDDPLNGGGGEYANQDGFGWTNGIAIKFMKSE
jgi:alpha,alpha-trehalase